MFERDVLFPLAGLDHPGCHLSTGMFADFFGRIADAQIAVLEVECRSMGDARCRFLAGSPETLSTIYDRMAQGAGYSPTRYHERQHRLVGQPPDQTRANSWNHSLTPRQIELGFRFNF